MDIGEASFSSSFQKAERKRSFELDILPQKLKKRNSLAFSPQANYTDRVFRRLSVKLVPTCADRGCRVVSAMGPHGR
jgi:hypothetical protein